MCIPHLGEVRRHVLQHQDGVRTLAAVTAMVIVMATVMVMATRSKHIIYAQKKRHKKKSGGKTQDMNQPISTRVAEPRRTLGMDAAGKAAGRVKQQYPPM